MARPAVVLLLFVPVLSAAEPPAPTRDATGLTGFWKPESVVFDGEEQFGDAKARQAITLVVKDGEYRVYFCKDKANDLHVRLVTAVLKADAGQKTIELTIKSGEKKGLKCHGIYEVKDGKLRVCYGSVEIPRPTKFEAPAGSQLFCEVWSVEK
jgi:uncharacterized protein (TIGR03067 family)